MREGSGRRDQGGEPDLSVVIVSRNTCGLLRACLESLAASGAGLATEVIVVDNGSSDGSAELVEEQFPSHRLIRNRTNTGFAFPNNQGIGVATGRYVLLLNSDTEVRAGALRTLVAFMDAHPGAAACGPALFFPGGRPQPSCRSFPTPWTHFCDMTCLDRLFPRSRTFGNLETRFPHDRTCAVEHVMGAALMLRRSALESIGLLDERFSIYYNDVDWCYRAVLAGWSVHFVREAEVVHHHGATRNVENRRDELTDEMTRNAFAYYRKHFGSTGLAWYRLWTVLGFSARRLLFAVAGPTRASAWLPASREYYGRVLRAALTGGHGGTIAVDPTTIART